MCSMWSMKNNPHVLYLASHINGLTISLWSFNRPTQGDADYDCVRSLNTNRDGSGLILSNTLRSPSSSPKTKV